MSSNRPLAHTLHFAQLERELTAVAGESVYHSARRQGVRIVGACGGRGTCGSCMVKVVHGAAEYQGQDLDADAADVVEHADPADCADMPGSGQEGATDTRHPRLRRKWLRACQTHVRGDCQIEIAARSLAPVVRAEFGADDGETLPLDPALRDVQITLPEPSLIDPLSDVDRLARGLAAQGLPDFNRVDLGCARTLSRKLREQRWSVSLRLRGDELIDVAPVEQPLLGLAVDLGTTNVAGFLIDLRSGKRLASLGLENPQSTWGADLISRINHAIRDDAAAEELRQAALTAIDALAHDLARAVGAQGSQIVDAVICGNTAMHHLLLGLPVRQLGRAPFVAAQCAAQDVRARDLGLHLSPGASVHLVGNVGGFVGGDHVAALLATEDQWETVDSALVMDIGTNTEISLIHGGCILSASCPSGPALEGGHIGCGMRAAEGAIERVTLRDGRLAVCTIGNKPAVGLCGSGVLDAVAAMLKAGITDTRGRIAADHPDVRQVNGQRAVQLAPGVFFTQADIRAVQLAKAAIRTGTRMLLREAELAEPLIERFVIAGAFGAYIDIGSGVATGLFPDLPRERFVQVGNAAGLGVRRMLASGTARARATRLARECRYIELSTRSDFQKTFVRSIGFDAQRAIHP
ncbi:MAG: DUF4445 domain-containing protein [Burkholderiaceae bacterium]|nr:DUF4445 domain-containing protein [Burkholderiaceae bacterium]